MPGISAAGGPPALAIDVTAEVARLQNDMNMIRGAVSAMANDVAKNARAANDNLSNIGRGASGNVIQFSAAVARLKGQVDPAWAALQKYKEEVFLASQALRAGALTQEQYNTAILRSRSAWQQSGQAVVSSSGAQAAGLRQLFMNLSDMTTMYSLGAKTSQIFASQIGQLVQSIQLMSMGAGKFATFMSNPWVIAITMATLVLGPLIANLFDAKKATEEVKLSANGLSDAQGTLGEMFDLATGKIKKNSDALRANNELLAINLRIEALKAKDDADAAFKKAGKSAFSVGDAMTADLPAYGTFAPSKAEKNTKALINLIDDLHTGVLNYSDAITRANKLDFTGTNTTKIEFLQGLADSLTSVSKNETAAAVEASMANGKLDDSLIKATKTHKQAHDTRAATLARESAATEALIAGLFDLADAYQKNDAAAKEAEITAKATEQGIKKQADVSAYVAQQKRLYVAQEAADAAKGVATIRSENDARVKYNNLVAQGLLTDEAAQKALQNEAQLRPLVTAAAMAEGDAKTKLWDITAALRAELKRSNDEEIRTQDIAQAAKGSRDLKQLSDEIALNERLGKARIAALRGIGGEKLEDELARINHEHEIETMRLRANADAAEQTRLGLTETAKTTLAIADANIKLSNDQFDFDQQALAIDRVNKHIEEFLTLLDNAASRADRAAQGMADAFGNVGEAIGKMAAQFAQYAADRARLEEDLRKAEKDQDWKKVADLKLQAQALQIENYRNLAGTAKTFFKEGSAGYKAMAAAEKAFALVQLANTAINVAAGAAKMFAMLGPWAFPAVAAMIAVMAALGFSGGHGGRSSVQTAEQVQAAQGTGTVLGDPTGKSESIAHSLDLVAKNTNKMLEYDNPMLRALKSIDNNIGALTSSLAKAFSLGGNFDQSQLALGSSTKGSSLVTGALGYTAAVGGGMLAGALIGGPVGLLAGLILTKVPIIGDILGGISKLIFNVKKTVSLVDQGVQFTSATLADAIQNGLDGQTYNLLEIKTKKKLFGIGIGGSTKYETQTTALDSDVERQIGLILGSLRDSVVEAAKILGLDVASALDTFKVEIGKISFKDMKPDEIEAALQAVFSKVGDQMAGFAVQGLEQFQKAGEGLFETLMRLAKDYQTVDVVLKSIGKTFGAVGAASIGARESLIALFGTLDDFVDATSFYQQNFLTPDQQLAPIQAQVKSTLASLGLSSVDTIAEFKAVVDGIDLTTDAGQQLYKSLMDLAPAFYAVEQAQEQAAQKAADLAKQRSSLEIQLLQAQGKTAEATAKQRELELAAADASLRPLMQQVYAAQDKAQAVAAAKDVLSQAYSRESAAMESTIDTLKNLKDNLLQVRDSIYDTSTGAGDYAAKLAALRRVGGLAGMGDQDAMGRLGGVISDFLPAALAHASSMADYRKAQALAAQYADSAISAADQGIALAQAQLDQLKALAGTAITIDEHVVTVAEAMEKLDALLDGSGSAPTGSGSSGSNGSPAHHRDRDEREERRHRDIMDRLGRVDANTAEGAIGSNKTARRLRDWDYQGQLATTTIPRST